MTYAATILRTGLKKIGTNWNWRLTVPKTIEMTLVRPLVTDFKMTVRADCTVACSTLPLSIKALARWLLVWGSSILDRHPPYLPTHTIAGIQNKAKFPCHQPELSWLLSSELPDLDLVTVWYNNNPTNFYQCIIIFWPKLPSLYHSSFKLPFFTDAHTS